MAYRRVPLAQVNCLGGLVISSRNCLKFLFLHQRELRHAMEMVVKGLSLGPGVCPPLRTQCKQTVHPPLFSLALVVSAMNYSRAGSSVVPVWHMLLPTSGKVAAVAWFSKHESRDGQEEGLPKPKYAQILVPRATTAHADDHRLWRCRRCSF